MIRKLKQISKRVVSGLLATIMCASSICITANAYLDDNKNAPLGSPMYVADGNYTPCNTGYTGHFAIYPLWGSSNVNTNVWKVFCLNENATIGKGTSHPYYKITPKYVTNKNLQSAIGIIIDYTGVQNKNASAAAYIATQTLIWEIKSGYRTADYNFTLTNSAVYNGTGIKNNATALTLYNGAVSQVRKLLKPVFIANTNTTSVPTVTLAWNASTQDFRKSVTVNTNGVPVNTIYSALTSAGFTVTGQNTSTWTISTKTQNTNGKTVSWSYGSKAKEYYEYSISNAYQPVLWATGQDPIQGGIKIVTNEAPHYTLTAAKNFVDPTNTTISVADTNELIGDVAFKIKDSNGKYVTATGTKSPYTYTGVNSTGTEFKLNDASSSSRAAFAVKNMPNGTYTIIESKNNTDYQWNGDVTVKISDADAKADLKNIERKYNVTITKLFKTKDDNTGKLVTLNADDSNELAPNIRFKIYDKDNNAWVKFTGSSAHYTYNGLTKNEDTATSLQLYINTNGNKPRFVVDLPNGNYTLVESSNTTDYEWEGDKDFIVANSDQSFNVTNIKNYNIVVSKTFKNTNNVELNNNEITNANLTNKVKFKIRTSSSKYIKATGSATNGYAFAEYVNTVDEATAFSLTPAENDDDKPSFTISGLEDGTYYVFESTNTTEYRLESEAKLVVKNGKGTADVSNRDKPDLTVYKRYKNTSGNSIDVTSSIADGTKFKVKINNGTNAGKYLVLSSTNFSGNTYTQGNYRYNGSSETGTEITLNSESKGFTINNLPNGTYIVEETKVPDGFTKAKPVTIKVSNANVTKYIDNSTIDLKVKKQDAYSGEPLDNCTFGMFKKTGNTVSTTATVTAITNTDGIAVFKNVKFGTYQIKEIKAPNHYLNDSDPIEVTINENSPNIIDLTTDESKIFKNTPQPVKISVIKSDSTDDTKTIKAGFTLYANEDYTPSLKYNEETDSYDYYMKGDEIATGYTKKVKVGGVYKNVLDFGNIVRSGYSYRLVETSVPEGYYDSGYNTTISADWDDTVAYKEITKSVENTPIEIEVDKVSAIGNTSSTKSVSPDDSPSNKYYEVNGAKLELYSGDLRKVTRNAENEALYTNSFITDWTSDGTNHKIKNLPAGTYTLIETYAPDGYRVITKIAFDVVVDDAHKTAKIVPLGDANNIKSNMFVKSNGTGSPILYAIDDFTFVSISKRRLDNGDELAGASLRLVDSTNNKTVESWTSDGTNHEFKAKLVVGRKYILKEITAPDGFIIATDIAFKVDNNNKVTILDSTAGVIENKTNYDIVVMNDDYTKVNVNKRTISGDAIIPGAKLAIIDTTNNKTVETFTSTNKTYSINAKLVAGRKYILRELEAPDGYALASDVTFTVSTDGSTDEVDIRDINLTELPTAGGIGTGIFSISGIFIMLVAVYMFKKRED